MKAILFDLDGTLTDPREGITRCIAHALERMGVAPPPLDELTFAIGPPLRDSRERRAAFRGDIETAGLRRAHRAPLRARRAFLRVAWLRARRHADLPTHLLPRHAIAPGDAAMIGDRGVDMRAARHHGLHGIGARWGYGTHDELTAAGAHSLCEGPAGLWRSIQSVSARR